MVKDEKRKPRDEICYWLIPHVLRKKHAFTASKNQQESGTLDTYARTF